MKHAIDILSTDPVLKPLLNTLSLSERISAHSPFTSLSRSIISQQISTKAAQAILSRCTAHFSSDFQPTDILKHSITELRALGISARKATYLQNIAAHHQNNTSFWSDITQYSDDIIIAQLTQIKGVGVWTAQMLLIFNLQREDVFPIGDLAIRDSICQLYGLDLNSPRKELYPQLEAIAANWSPYRSIASRYLWQWRDQQRT